MDSYSNGRIDLRGRLNQLARERGSDVAVIEVHADGSTSQLCWSELVELTNVRTIRLKSLLRDVGPVVVGIRADNSICAVVMILSALCSGLTVLPLNPETFKGDMVKQVRVGSALNTLALDVGEISSPKFDGNLQVVDETAIPTSGYLLETGGSTGSPRLVHVAGPVEYSDRLIPDALEIRSRWRSGQRQLVVGPIFHAAPFTFLLHGILDANTVILQRNFLPAQTVSLIDDGVEWMQMTPTHLKTIADLARPERSVFTRLNGLLHTAARCETETKYAWIDLLGPHRLFESYAATEGIGVTLASGDEWLERPGTVGRGVGTQIKIMSENGTRLGPGTIGEVFLRKAKTRRKVPSSARTTVDGFMSVGDMGWVDNDGYLYLSSRRDDMFTVGGENVYPEEIERTIRTHPAVDDCVVIPHADHFLENAVGAVVTPRTGNTIDPQELRSFLRKWLPWPKIPRRIRVVDEIPRTSAGKIERKRIVDLATD